MAVQLGVSSGFVAAAPTADPDGSTLYSNAENWRHYQKCVAPDGATSIEAIYAYYNNYHWEDSNTECAVYSHNSGTDRPDERLHFCYTGTGLAGAPEGWRLISSSDAMGWAVTGGATYWLAYYMPAVSGTPYLDQSSESGSLRLWYSSASLPTPFDGNGAPEPDSVIAVAAVYAGGGGGSIIVPQIDMMARRRR